MLFLVPWWFFNSTKNAESDIANQLAEFGYFEISDVQEKTEMFLIWFNICNVVEPLDVDNLLKGQILQG